MEPKIIFEDKYLLIIDKPAGWIVNEAETTGKQKVIQSWLKENCNYSTVRSKQYRSGIVHRLDKETSGLVIIAKTKEAFNDLQLKFKKRLVNKVYKTLVHGEVVFDEGEIEVPVGRLPWNRERFGVVPGGRKAFTKYKVDSKYQHRKTKEKLSLLNVYPRTGRTHQIRVHMKYLGHAVVADEFYAGRKTAKNDRLWCSRLFLHATIIEFIHPRRKISVSYESKLPNDLKSALKALEKTS